MCAAWVSTMKTSFFMLLTFIIFTSAAVAQSHKDRLEVGVHSTSLSLFDPDFASDQTHAGFGGRVTYNFNKWIAAEGEVNFFPQRLLILRADGNGFQGQFGAKVGKRFEKFGVFAKVRPGFLSVDRVFTLQSLSPVVTFTVDRKTFFTLDAGGVLELYPSKRMVVRFEASDLIVHHPERIDQVSIPELVPVRREPKFNNNFQFTAGVAFRLGEFPADDGNVPSTSGANQETPRYEAGLQFTSMSVNPPTVVCAFCVVPFDDSVHTEPGFGGRFTFNLNENIAVEAEGNYFTRDRFGISEPSGHMFQAQFGGKVGKRFDRWGLFGKARPGFVGYTEVTELIGTRVVTFGPLQSVVGDFRTVHQLYPSVDVGGVVEFYVSRSWMARFDVGDTIIRYGPLHTIGTVAAPVFTRPAEWRHNLQISSGIGFRF
jgi:outer membrane protein with beta-barrel domain